MFRLLWEHNDLKLPQGAGKDAKNETAKDVQKLLSQADGGTKLLGDRKLLARAVVHFEEALGFGQPCHCDAGGMEVRHGCASWIRA